MTVNFWFHLAEEYLKLAPTTRFKIGYELGLLDEHDAHLTVDEIDDTVFIQMHKRNLTNEFIGLVHKAANG
jgi:hypothetical protein